MTHGSLFSGIGGFDLAAEWMGWENVFHCEWNEFGQKVLKHYWPKAITYNDITKTDFTIHRGAIDILTGGFPCQPYSLAGKRKGKEDDRHLWPQMLRAIREIQPRYIVGENVFGLVNWNGGLVFDEVQADLEAAGYEVQPFILPACAVGAPHRRDRIWFVAYAYGDGRSENTKSKQSPDEKNNEQSECLHNQEFISDSDDIIRGSKSQIGVCEERSRSEFERGDKNVNGNTGRTGWEEQHPPGFAAKPGFGSRGCNAHVANFNDFPTQSPICNGDDEFSARLDAITFPKWRNESIKAGGNAVVPALVHQIFKAIEQYEKINS